MSVIGTILTGAAAVGQFLAEHGDLVEDLARAIAGGAPKEALRASIKAVQVKVSDEAIREELTAADERRRMG